MSTRLRRHVDDTTRVTCVYIGRGVPFSVYVGVQATNDAPFCFVSTTSKGSRLRGILRVLTIMSGRSSVCPCRGVLSFCRERLADRPCFLRTKRLGPTTSDTVAGVDQGKTFLFRLRLLGRRTRLEPLRIGTGRITVR